MPSRLAVCMFYSILMRGGALACAQVVQMSGEGKLSIGGSPRETRVRLDGEVFVGSRACVR